MTEIYLGKAPTYIENFMKKNAWKSKPMMFRDMRPGGIVQPTKHTFDGESDIKLQFSRSETGPWTQTYPGSQNILAVYTKAAGTVNSFYEDG